MESLHNELCIELALLLMASCNGMKKKSLQAIKMERKILTKALVQKKLPTPHATLFSEIKIVHP